MSEIRTNITYDEASDIVIVDRIQDVEPTLDAMKEARSIGAVGANDMRYAGHIPHVVIEKYLADNGITLNEFMVNDVHLVRLMNDPDYKLLRAWEGRL